MTEQNRIQSRALGRETGLLGNVTYKRDKRQNMLFYVSVVIEFSKTRSFANVTNVKHELGKMRLRDNYLSTQVLFVDYHKCFSLGETSKTTYSRIVHLVFRFEKLNVLSIRAKMSGRQEVKMFIF